MRPINLRSTATTLVVVFASIALCSFAVLPGGDSYEVYLNDQVVKKEHLYGRKEVPTLPLNMNTAQDELSITFSHCGKIDTGRKISLKDEKNATLKEWNFTDSPDVRNRMAIKVSAITGFRNQHSTARLMYSAREYPDGVQLVTLELSEATAQKK